MALARDSVPLCLDEVEYTVLRPVKFFKGLLVHDHELLSVWRLEHNVFSVGCPRSHSVHFSVANVHLSLAPLDLLIKLALLLLPVLVVLQGGDFLCWQIRLKQIHVHCGSLCCLFYRFALSDSVFEHGQANENGATYIGSFDCSCLAWAFAALDRPSGTSLFYIFCALVGER